MWVKLTNFWHGSVPFIKVNIFIKFEPTTVYGISTMKLNEKSTKISATEIVDYCKFDFDIHNKAERLYLKSSLDNVGQ